MQARVSTHVGRAARGLLLGERRAGRVKAERPKRRPDAGSTLAPNEDRWEFDVAVRPHAKARSGHAHAPSWAQAICGQTTGPRGPVTLQRDDDD